MKQRLLVFSLVMALLLSWSATVWSKNTETPMAWTNLQDSLSRSGFDRAYLAKVFNDPRAEFLPNVVTKIAYLRKEKKADYSHFLSSANVEKGRRFLVAQNRLLTQAENTYGVSRKIITAILTVESDLGDRRRLSGFQCLFLPGRHGYTGSYQHVGPGQPPRRPAAEESGPGANPSSAPFSPIAISNHLNPSCPSKAPGPAPSVTASSCPPVFCAAAPTATGMAAWTSSVMGPRFIVSQLLAKIRFPDGQSGFLESGHPRLYNHSDPYVETVLTLAQWY